MLCTGDDFTVQPYAHYKNQKVKKHRDKFINQLRQITECSLKPEDKKTLIKDLIAMAHEELKK